MCYYSCYYCYYYNSFGENCLSNSEFLFVLKIFEVAIKNNPTTKHTAIYIIYSPKLLKYCEETLYKNKLESEILFTLSISSLKW